MAVMNEQQRRFLTAVGNVQLLHAIGRKARLRERVVCSATTYVHRGLPESVDVLLRLTTALWVASKVEEAPVSVATLIDAVSKLGFGSRSFSASNCSWASATQLRASASPTRPALPPKCTHECCLTAQI